MQAQQDDDAEDDGGEENLSDVVIEDLLVGVRGVVKVRVFLSECFAAEDEIDWSEFVLFYVHVLDSLGWNTEVSLRLANVIHGGVPVFSRGKGVYNKGSPSLQLFSAKICRLIPTGG
jgi:hypothetical protein